MVQQQILLDLTDTFEVHLPDQQQQQLVRNQQQNQNVDLLPYPFQVSDFFLNGWMALG